jgi:alpha-beta hydrolase superfamily lysophospholipase
LPADDAEQGRQKRSMPEEPQISVLPLARPLAQSQRPAIRTLTLPDGYETSVWIHQPPRSLAKGLPVLYMHGIQSHPGWFVGSARAMAQAGHAVYQVIRRGSGDNAKDRGHAQSAQQLLKDVECAAHFILNQTNQTSMHLVGVSWGGKLLAAYATWPHRKTPIASLTLIAPGIAPKVDMPALTKLRVAWAILTNPTRRFDIPLNNVELFTDNAAMRNYLSLDPFRLKQATASFFYTSRQLDKMLKRGMGVSSGMGVPPMRPTAVPAVAGAPAVAPPALAGARPASMQGQDGPATHGQDARATNSFPTTLILAKFDGIIDNPATIKKVKRLAGESLRIVELPGHHTLEFEPNPQPFYDELTDAVRGR